MKYENIEIGAVYSFERKLSREDGLAFAKISGDFNKLHIDASFGEKTRFGQNIVHGMLAGSLFSALVGMHCLLENSVYVSQTLNFKRPIFYGDGVSVKGTVINKNDSVKLITLKTEILKEGRIVVDGEARIKALE